MERLMDRKLERLHVNPSSASLLPLPLPLPHPLPLPRTRAVENAIE